MAVGSWLHNTLRAIRITRITAFDEITRNRMEPANHRDGKFDYLNSSGRPEAEAVRSLIDSWLENYPSENLPEMIRRLRSNDDINHSSAFFELLLHELLLRRGFSIVEIEPTLSNGKSPDFLVEAPDGSRFYLEATLATGLSKTSQGAQRRLCEAIQAIDEIQSPDYHLLLHTRGSPSRPISLRRLKGSLESYLKALDYNEVLAKVQAGEQFESVWHYQEHGADFEVQPIPKSKRKHEDRAIVGRNLPSGIMNAGNAIKASIQTKAGRYGDIDLPLVVAVNTLEEFSDTTDAIDALFGSPGAVINSNGDCQLLRIPDGVWQGLGGPVYTRSSALLFATRLSPWDVAQRDLQLIHNPWARKPLPEYDWGVHVHRVADGQLQMEAGMPLAQIFQLPNGWPEAENVE